MKALLLMLSAALPWHSAPQARRWLVIADSLLEGANAADYITTRRGAFPGTGGCELNPLVTRSPCQIDVLRFTALKLGTAAFGFVQLVPGLKSKPLVRTLTLIDTALAETRGH